MTLFDGITSRLVETPRLTVNVLERKGDYFIFNPSIKQVVGRFLVDETHVTFYFTQHQRVHKLPRWKSRTTHISHLTLAN